MRIFPYEHSLAQDILLTKKNAPMHNQGTFVTYIICMYFQGVLPTPHAFPWLNLHTCMLKASWLPKVAHMQTL